MMTHRSAIIKTDGNTASYVPLDLGLRAIEPADQIVVHVGAVPLYRPAATRLALIHELATESISDNGELLEVLAR